ncbi:MAG: M16 family metallopeptidase [Clostridiaceae bacterium]
MYSFFRLNNGLRVVIEKLENFNSVSVGLWIKNGSRNEDINCSGISHFIEHMLFKGTEKRTSKEIIEAIEDYGGQINAFTTKETTCYYTKTLDKYVEDSLEILSDMLFNSEFNEVEIEKEKGVVLEEISMSEDSPEDVLSDLHFKAIYGNSSISFPILGSKENVSKFTKEDIKSYIEKYYIPENSVISICGNISDDITTLVEKYFGSWKSSDKKILTSYSSPEFNKDILFKSKPIEQTHISLGLRGFELGNKNNYALTLVNNYFGGSGGSLLFQKIREDLGMCYSIYSFNAAYVNAGALCIYCATSPKYLNDTISNIKNLIDNLVSTDINEEKLTKLKDQLIGGYLLGLESTSSRMFSNGKNALFLNKINTQQEVIDKIQSVSKENIKFIIDEIFSKGILNGSIVGKDVDMDSIKKILF